MQAAAKSHLREVGNFLAAFDKARATSYKLQAASYKLQVTSYKLQVTKGTWDQTAYNEERLRRL